MAKPAASLFLLGFCLVLVISMSSRGVNAVACEFRNVQISACKSACEKLFADACKSTCEKVGFVSSKVVLERSRLALDTFYIPKCQCCR
ncbi:hypothetical protein MKW92_047835 [Papaver armeniacum]|nr:hypothetical protein MKW92_047835 [Papaver armeniacum]